MAVCESKNWTIWFSNDKTPTVFDPLFFELEVGTNGQITGQVFQGDFTQPLSEVTGLCEPIERPDGTLMRLRFTWDPVEVFLHGFTHTQGTIKKFKGRFIALTAMSDSDVKFETALLPLAPGDGDTGTGTGQQT